MHNSYDYKTFLLKSRASTLGIPRCPKSETGSPEGPRTQYLRLLVPKTILLMVFGNRILRYWILGPSAKLLKASELLDQT